MGNGRPIGYSGHDDANKKRSFRIIKLFFRLRRRFFRWFRIVHLIFPLRLLQLYPKRWPRETWKRRVERRTGIIWNSRQWNSFSGSNFISLWDIFCSLFIILPWAVCVVMARHTPYGNSPYDDYRILYVVVVNTHQYATLVHATQLD